jgi:transcriptional regulator GlxA family with amidase domain
MLGGARQLNVALLATPDTTVSMLYGMYDLFSSAGRGWDYIIKGVAGEPRMHPYIVSAQLPGLYGLNRIWIRPDHSLDDCPPPQIICLPDIMVVPGESIAGRFEPEIAWLRKHHEAGATLTSVCTGSLILAEAGLLDGLDATIHWGWSKSLSANYPKVRVHTNRTLIANGPGQRIIMAGGATSWHDLSLFLIARFVGLREAMEVSKMYLIDWHDIGQQPFASLAAARQVEDALIGKCQEWAALHYAEASPVATMIRISGLSDRTFNRRFVMATGMSPMDYVHILRLEEAKQTLETTDQPVEAIANQVGYEDSSFFNRLFRRKVGLTPAHYRRRFGSLRRALTRDAS